MNPSAPPHAPPPGRHFRRIVPTPPSAITRPQSYRPMPPSSSRPASVHRPWRPSGPTPSAVRARTASLPPASTHSAALPPKPRKAPLPDLFRAPLRLSHATSAGGRRRAASLGLATGPSEGGSLCLPAVLALPPCYPTYPGEQVDHPVAVHVTDIGAHSVTLRWGGASAPWPLAAAPPLPSGAVVPMSTDGIPLVSARFSSLNVPSMPSLGLEPLVRRGGPSAGAPTTSIAVAKASTKQQQSIAVVKASTSIAVVKASTKQQQKPTAPSSKTSKGGTKNKKSALSVARRILNSSSSEDDQPLAESSSDPTYSDSSFRSTSPSSSESETAASAASTASRAPPAGSPALANGRGHIRFAPDYSAADVPVPLEGAAQPLLGQSLGTLLLTESTVVPGPSSVYQTLLHCRLEHIVPLSSLVLQVSPIEWAVRAIDSKHDADVVVRFRAPPVESSDSDSDSSSGSSSQGSTSVDIPGTCVSGPFRLAAAGDFVHKIAPWGIPSVDLSRVDGVVVAATHGCDHDPLVYGFELAVCSGKSVGLRISGGVSVEVGLKANRQPAVTRTSLSVPSRPSLRRETGTSKKKRPVGKKSRASSDLRRGPSTRSAHRNNVFNRLAERPSAAAPVIVRPTDSVLLNEQAVAHAIFQWAATDPQSRISCVGYLVLVSDDNGEHYSIAANCPVFSTSATLTKLSPCVSYRVSVLAINVIPWIAKRTGMDPGSTVQAAVQSFYLRNGSSTPAPGHLPSEDPMMEVFLRLRGAMQRRTIKSRNIATSFGTNPAVHRRSRPPAVIVHFVTAAGQETDDVEDLILARDPVPYPAPHSDLPTSF